MLTVTAILDQYAWLNSPLPIAPDIWDHQIPVNGAYAAIKRVAGIDYVMFRGSCTFMDWVEDFADAAIPYNDPLLGPVHPGARTAVLEIKDPIDDLVGEHVVFVGHSLGALHAGIAAGYRVKAGKPVDGLVLFGEPRPGGPELSAILKNIPIQSYRNADGNGHDRVTDVPFPIPNIAQYDHLREPLIDCCRSPAALDPWGFFRYHHLKLYSLAFGCGGPAVLSLTL